MESSCKYTKKAVADSQQEVALQLEGWAWGYKVLIIKGLL
jgi:hypothetical protein